VVHEEVGDDVKIISRRKLFQQILVGGGVLAASDLSMGLTAQSGSLKSVQLDGFEMFYECHGTGPAVVFAHGAGGTHLSWWQQIPFFSEHFQCVTFDHRGFGRSRDVGDKPGQRAFVQDLLNLLDHLDIQKAALVGQSMGGWTALGFASSFPERVTALVMCDSPGGYTNSEVDRLMAARFEDREAFAKSFSEQEPELAFLYEGIRRSTVDRTSDDWSNLRRGLFSAPVDASRVIENEIPTLFVVGEEDSIFPPELIEAVHRDIPGSELAIIPDAGHSVYFERPKVFNRLVKEFLKRYVSSVR
jgi:3-oxoadipate enol-lactonase